MLHRQLHCDLDSVCPEADLGLGSEIIRQNALQELHSEAFMSRAGNLPVCPFLHPFEVDMPPAISVTDVPAYRDRSAVLVVERAMLHGVGGKLVKREAEEFRGLRLER